MAAKNKEAGERRACDQPLDIKTLKKDSREREAAFAGQSFLFNHPYRRDTIRCALSSDDETPGLSLTVLNFRRRCYQFMDRTGRLHRLYTTRIRLTDIGSQKNVILLEFVTVVFEITYTILQYYKLIE